MSTYTLRKVEELNGGVPWTSIADADLLVVKKGGVDGFAPWSALRTQVPNLGYLSGLFDNTDLNPSFIWTLNHAKNTRNCFLLIKNPAGEYQNSLVPYLVDANNIAINFGGAIESGDWEYTFIYFTAAAEATYPDSTYALAVHSHVESSPSLNQATKNAALTLNSFTCYKYGSIVTISMRITTTNAFTTSDAEVGILSVAPGNTFYFPGAMENTSGYEGACGSLIPVTEGGTTAYLRVRLGKANQTYRFNITFSTNI